MLDSCTFIDPLTGKKLRGVMKDGVCVPVDQSGLEASRTTHWRWRSFQDRARIQGYEAPVMPFPSGHPEQSEGPLDHECSPAGGVSGLHPQDDSKKTPIQDSTDLLSSTEGGPSTASQDDPKIKVQDDINAIDSLLIPHPSNSNTPDDFQTNEFILTSIEKSLEPVFIESNLKQIDVKSLFTKENSIFNLPSAGVSTLTPNQAQRVEEFDENDETPTECENPAEDSLNLLSFQPMKILRREFKTLVPFLPELRKYHTVSEIIYLCHMLWYVALKACSRTGLIAFQSSKTARYLGICTKTERRIRQIFVERGVFVCHYNRSSHLLLMGVNGEGFKKYFSALGGDASLIQTAQDETNVESYAKDLHEQVKTAQAEHASLKLEESLVEEEMESLRSVEPFVRKTLKGLSPDQIQMSLKDLGVVKLLDPKDIKRGLRYFHADPDHILYPYKSFSGEDGCRILHILGKVMPDTIPSQRPVDECPDYFYKGTELEHLNHERWSNQERATFQITRNLALRMGLKHYLIFIGQFTVVDWVLDDNLHFVDVTFAARNTSMAAILGAVFLELYVHCGLPYMPHIIPLQGPDLPYCGGLGVED